jgi:CBS domain-containing protein
MRTVSDAMIAPPVLVEASMTVQEASAGMVDAGRHAAVVLEDGRLRGLATAEDVSRALAAGRDATRTLVGEIAPPGAPVAHADEPLAEAHLRMRGEHHRVVAVLGDDGRPVGILEDSEA